MKIIDTTRRHNTFFMDIPKGQVFRYKERYAISIDSTPINNTIGINAIFIDNGEATTIDGYEPVDTDFEVAITIYKKENKEINE